MRAVDLLVNSLLPEDLKDPSRRYDKKGLDDLMAQIAQRHPDRYREISKQISDIGRKAAYLQGETLRLSDMRPVLDKDALFATMDHELDVAKRSSKTTKDFEAKRLVIWEKYSNELEKQTISNAMAQGNNLGNTVISGARGNPFQLKAMISSPVLYTDYKDRPINRFIRRSFGEGLRPADYLASMFGVRKSVVSTKRSTAQGGDLGKIMAQSVADQIVTEEDCGASTGLDFEADSKDLLGRVTVRDYGKVPAGTPIDRHVLKEFRTAGAKMVVARSPLTCQAKRGLCAHCLGTLPTGRFAPLGYAAGITAANAISEPVVQGSLNCLREGTLVRMADYTVRPIQEVRVGERVLGADKTGKTFPVVVTAKWDQGLQPAQRHTYRMGQTEQLITLESTSKHPVLVNKKNYGHGSEGNNRKIVMLPAGYKHSELAAVLPVTTCGDGKTEALALLIGVMLGDGIRNCAGSELRFSCADKSQIHALAAQYPELQFKKRKRSHDWSVGMLKDASRQDARSGRMLPGLRNPVKKKLQELGLLHCYAYEKFIPAEVWTWDAKSISAMVSGYLATDGSVFKNDDGHIGVSFGSTSKVLLQELKELLAVRLNIFSSSLTLTGEAGEGGRQHDMWQFYITRHDQVEKLAAVLPAIPGVKQARLTAYLREASYVKRNTEGFYRAKRIGIEELGLQQCWDLTVSHEAHLFVLANGLIVSNTKHSGGGFTGGKKTFGGFEVIEQLVQSPEVFPHRAAVAEIDGQVDRIEDAPQGGKFIYIGAERHYALPGYEPIVKPGDMVEAGDQMSEGISDVSDIVRLRGLGEGRRYYVDRLRQAFVDSGMAQPAALNMEMLARGAINHVKITDPNGMGDYLPDDTAFYDHLAASYEPPDDAKVYEPRHAQGRYLQSPALHYSIGTKLTPKMITRLQGAGVEQIVASDNAPNFEPEMVRLRAAKHDGTDWMAKMHTSYLGTNLGRDAMRARDTNVERNTHFAPRLAIGKDFGKNVTETGYF